MTAVQGQTRVGNGREIGWPNMIAWAPYNHRPSVRLARGIEPKCIKNVVMMGLKGHGRKINDAPAWAFQSHSSGGNAGLYERFTASEVCGIFEPARVA